jgi:hypothetical protein
MNDLPFSVATNVGRPLEQNDSNCSSQSGIDTRLKGVHRQEGRYPDVILKDYANNLDIFLKASKDIKYLVCELRNKDRYLSLRFDRAHKTLINRGNGVFYALPTGESTKHYPKYFISWEGLCIHTASCIELFSYIDKPKDIAMIMEGIPGMYDILHYEGLEGPMQEYRYHSLTSALPYPIMMEAKYDGYTNEDLVSSSNYCRLVFHVHRTGVLPCNGLVRINNRLIMPLRLDEAPDVIAPNILSHFRIINEYTTNCYRIVDDHDAYPLGSAMLLGNDDKLMIPTILKWAMLKEPARIRLVLPTTQWGLFHIMEVIRKTNHTAHANFDELSSYPYLEDSKYEWTEPIWVGMRRDDITLPPMTRWYSDADYTLEDLRLGDGSIKIHIDSYKPVLLDAKVKKCHVVHSSLIALTPKLVRILGAEIHKYRMNKRKCTDPTISYMYRDLVLSTWIVYDYAYYKEMLIRNPGTYLVSKKGDIYICTTRSYLDNKFSKELLHDLTNYPIIMEKHVLGLKSPSSSLGHPSLHYRTMGNKAYGPGYVSIKSGEIYRNIYTSRADFHQCTRVSLIFFTLLNTYHMDDVKAFYADATVENLDKYLKKHLSYNLRDTYTLGQWMEHLKQYSIPFEYIDSSTSFSRAIERIKTLTIVIIDLGNSYHSMTYQPHVSPIWLPHLFVEEVSKVLGKTSHTEAILDEIYMTRITKGIAPAQLLESDVRSYVNATGTPLRFINDKTESKDIGSDPKYVVTSLIDGHYKCEPIREEEEEKQVIKIDNSFPRPREKLNKKQQELMDAWNFGYDNESNHDDLREQDRLYKMAKKAQKKGKKSIATSTVGSIPSIVITDPKNRPRPKEKLVDPKENITIDPRQVNFCTGVKGYYAINSRYSLRIDAYSAVFAYDGRTKPVVLVQNADELVNVVHIDEQFMLARAHHKAFQHNAFDMMRSYLMAKIKNLECSPDMPTLMKEAMTYARARKNYAGVAEITPEFVASVVQSVIDEIKECQSRYTHMMKRFLIWPFEIPNYYRLSTVTGIKWHYFIHIRNDLELDMQETMTTKSLLWALMMNNWRRLFRSLIVYVIRKIVNMIVVRVLRYGLTKYVQMATGYSTEVIEQAAEFGDMNIGAKIALSLTHPKIQKVLSVTTYYYWATKLFDLGLVVYNLYNLNCNLESMMVLKNAGNVLGTLERYYSRRFHRIPDRKDKLSSEDVKFYHALVNHDEKDRQIKGAVQTFVMPKVSVEHNHNIKFDKPAVAIQQIKNCLQDRDVIGGSNYYKLNGLPIKDATATVPAHIPEKCDQNMWYALMDRHVATKLYPSRRIMKKFAKFVRMRMDYTLLRFYILNDDFGVQDYIDGLESSKRRLYTDAWKKHDSMDISVTLQCMMKGDEISPPGYKYRPRNLFCPDPVTRLIFGFMAAKLIRSLKILFPGFIHALNMDELAEKLKLDHATLANPIFIGADFSSYDSHAHVSFIKCVDRTFNQLIPDILINTPFEYLMAIAIQKFSSLNLRFKLILTHVAMTIFGTIYGTTFSGLPERTTLMNTLRTLLILLFILWVASIPEYAAIVYAAGDDSLTLLERRFRKAFVESLELLTLDFEPEDFMRYGLGQVVKEISMHALTCTFLSKRIFYDNGQIYICRKQDRLRSMSNIYDIRAPISMREHRLAVNYSNYYTCGHNMLSKQSYITPRAIPKLDFKTEAQIKYSYNSHDIPDLVLSIIAPIDLLASIRDDYKQARVIPELVEIEKEKFVLGTYRETPTFLWKRVNPTGVTSLRTPVPCTRAPPQSLQTGHQKCTVPKQLLKQSASLRRVECRSRIESGIILTLVILILIKAISWLSWSTYIRRRINNLHALWTCWNNKSVQKTSHPQTLACLIAIDKISTDPRSPQKMTSSQRKLDILSLRKSWQRLKHNMVSLILLIVSCVILSCWMIFTLSLLILSRSLDQTSAKLLLISWLPLLVLNFDLYMSLFSNHPMRLYQIWQRLLCLIRLMVSSLSLRLSWLPTLCKRRNLEYPDKTSSTLMLLIKRMLIKMINSMEWPSMDWLPCYVQKCIPSEFKMRTLRRLPSLLVTVLLTLSLAHPVMFFWLLTPSIPQLVREQSLILCSRHHSLHGPRVQEQLLSPERRSLQAHYQRTPRTFERGRLRPSPRKSYLPRLRTITPDQFTWHILRTRLDSVSAPHLMPSLPWLTLLTMLTTRQVI